LMAEMEERNDKIIELASAIGTYRDTKVKFSRAPSVGTAIWLQAAKRRHRKAVEDILEVVGGKDHGEER